MNEAKTEEDILFWEERIKRKYPDKKVVPEPVAEEAEAEEEEEKPKQKRGKK